MNMCIHCWIIFKKMLDKFSRRPSYLIRFSVSTLNVVKVDFERLISISIVKNSKDVFARTVYCFAQEEVGEEEIVWRVVQVVVSILKIYEGTLIAKCLQCYISGGVESLLRCSLQLRPRQSAKLLIESFQRLLSDELRLLPGHDHVEQHLGQTLHPDGEVVHARGSELFN